jgi:hypothetical protein
VSLASALREIYILCFLGYAPAYIYIPRQWKCALTSPDCIHVLTISLVIRYLVLRLGHAHCAQRISSAVLVPIINCVIPVPRSTYIFMIIHILLEYSWCIESVHQGMPALNVMVQQLICTFGDTRTVDNGNTGWWRAPVGFIGELACTAMPRKLTRQVLRNKQHSISLLDFSLEVLTEILESLDWPDILRLRQVSSVALRRKYRSLSEGFRHVNCCRTQQR